METNPNPEENEEIIEGEEQLTPEEIAYNEEYEAAFNGEEPEEAAEEPEPTPGEEEAAPGEEEQPGEPEDTEQPDTDSNPDEQPGEEEEPELVTILWRGKEIQVTEQEKTNLAQQAYDYTYKTQQLSKERKEFESEKELLDKIKKGDKEALAQLAHQAGVDPIDLLDVEVGDNEQGEPAPAEEPFISPQVNELMQEVQKDPELYQKMYEVQETLPSNVLDVMAKDPETFYAVVNEVRSGDADVVLPQVEIQLASLPELDRALVMNNPEQFKNFYLNVKQSLSQGQGEEQAAPAQTRKAKPNRNEVSVRRSSNQQRGNPEGQDAFTSDSTYEETLKRLNSQN